jgi:hypothetical protein
MLVLKHKNKQIDKKYALSKYLHSDAFYLYRIERGVARFITYNLRGTQISLGKRMGERWC